MSPERRTGDYEEHRYPASLYFSSVLQQAIEAGDAEAIVAAVPSQEENHVTRAISNQLMMRSFLLVEKDELVELDKNLTETGTIREAAQLVAEYTSGLRDQFSDMFIASESEDPLTKLNSDEFFRELLEEPSKELPAIARRIADVDMGKLLAPGDMLNVMKYVVGTMNEELLEKADSLRVKGISAAVMRAMHTAVAEQIDGIDGAVLDCLAPVKKSK